MGHLNKIKELRLARAWSQEQLAELAGLSVRTVQRIENGERPGLETLSALAAVFEVSVAELSGPYGHGDDALDRRILEAKIKVADEGKFYRSVIKAVVICLFFFILNHFSSNNSQWALWVSGVWGGVLVLSGLRIFVFDGTIKRWKQKRLQQVLRK